MALGLPVPRYPGFPLDPPLRSRFQGRFVPPPPAAERQRQLEQHLRHGHGSHADAPGSGGGDDSGGGSSIIDAGAASDLARRLIGFESSVAQLVECEWMAVPGMQTSLSVGTVLCVDPTVPSGPVARF